MKKVEHRVLESQTAMLGADREFLHQCSFDSLKTFWRDVTTANEEGEELQSRGLDAQRLLVIFVVPQQPEELDSTVNFNSHYKQIRENIKIRDSLREQLVRTRDKHRIVRLADLTRLARFAQALTSEAEETRRARDIVMDERHVAVFGALLAQSDNLHDSAEERIHHAEVRTQVAPHPGLGSTERLRVVAL